MQCPVCKNLVHAPVLLRSGSRTEQLCECSICGTISSPDRTEKAVASDSLGRVLHGGALSVLRAPQLLLRRCLHH